MKLIHSYADRISSEKKFNCNKFRVKALANNYFFVEPAANELFEIEAATDCYIAGVLAIRAGEKLQLILRQAGKKTAEFQRYEWQILKSIN